MLLLLLKINVRHIQSYGVNAVHWDIPAIEKYIRELESLVIDESFQEFSDEATEAKINSLCVMQLILSEKQETKRVADEAAEQLKRDQAVLAGSGDRYRASMEKPGCNLG